MSQVSLSSFIWSVAALLRSDYKQSDYGKVILTFVEDTEIQRAIDLLKERRRPLFRQQLPAKSVGEGLVDMQEAA